MLKLALVIGEASEGTNYFGALCQGIVAGVGNNNAADVAQSKAAGHIVQGPKYDTIADGLRGKQLSDWYNVLVFLEIFLVGVLQSSGIMNLSFSQCTARCVGIEVMWGFFK